jgi:hypothetical protein
VLDAGAGEPVGRHFISVVRSAYSIGEEKVE